MATERTSNPGSVLLVLLLATAGILSVPGVLAAGCKSDCEDTYQSAIEDCHMTNDSADDADALQLCIQDVKDEYDSCIDDCNS
jgi:hypothetical protein